MALRSRPAPDLRTFIDGRTEHYPIERAVEYQIVTRGITAENSRLSLQILDSHEVDFFYAVGGPGYPYVVGDTWGCLDGVPGWVPVFRSLDLVVYMRQRRRNEVNGRRIEKYYSRSGIPFDSLRGIDTADIIENHPDWAVAHRMVPQRYTDLRREAGGTGQGSAAAALELAGSLYMAREYQGAARFGLKAAAEKEQAQEGSAVAVRALLQLGDHKGALSLVEELRWRHPGHSFLEALQKEVENYVADATGERTPPPH